MVCLVLVVFFLVELFSNLVFLSETDGKSWLCGRFIMPVCTMRSVQHARPLFYYIIKKKAAQKPLLQFLYQPLTVVFFVEFLHTASSIECLLFSGVKRMRSRRNFYSYHWIGVAIFPNYSLRRGHSRSGKEFEIA